MKSYVYRITYPNGKIYIGQDRKELFTTYFGSGIEEYINKDFSEKELYRFNILKEILWASDTATKDEIDQKETEMILKYESNNLEKGYNQRLPIMPK
ncbi:MAG: hypothetical protein LBU17_04435 [Treponema sp.]|jgi:CRISPR/Cas system-associated protein Csx1|nr:hypothetical protein [Treponema sp.]